MTVYVDHMEGDISTIDNLNHYIGMATLEDAAQIERQLAPLAMFAVVLMVAATAFIHRKWFAPLVLPAMLFPLVFLADMFLLAASLRPEPGPARGPVQRGEAVHARPCWAMAPSASSPPTPTSSRAS